MLLFSLLLSCQDKSSDTAQQALECDSGETVVGVISIISYARIENNTVWGFNIDGLDSTSSDPNGCYKADLPDPDGNPGVDNAFAALIPALESTEAVALESLLQQSINGGNLLLMIEITGVNDLQNDECVNINLYRGAGIPLVGTDGLLLDGQSFQKDLTLPHSSLQNAAIINGQIKASPLEIQLPVQVLDEDLDFHMTDGGLFINLSEDGSMSGFFGGAIPIQTLTDITTLPDVNLPDAIVGLVASAADLYPNANGGCDGFSVAFQYQALPSFFTLDIE